MTAAAAPRAWKATNPEFRERVRGAFDANRAMALIGAVLGEVGPGLVEIRLPISEMHMSHIPGVVHGGTLGMIADSALGFAALSLVPAETNGVTAEYKINLLAAAVGHEAYTRAEVVRPGTKLTVARADVWDVREGEEKLVAIALATLVAL